MSTRREITNRDDVFLLVSTFYNKIKKDDFIGPIFLETIPEDEWDPHIDKLTGFWESTLFYKRAYKGNPMKAHIDVDTHFENSITQKHFGKWLELWFSTVDSLFVGDKAHEAKERARNIASLLFLRIFEARKLLKD
ncbi:group III truncated hemoglobin [Pseudotenacibaculum haliotis]|uniref:Group III truncated hemoglobin n=1 Tax=Pseudotenacibaculum haliotis TaxID=1862138 RepID=A0ABW5LT04_9FLAO